MLVHHRDTSSICPPGWREALWELSVLPKNTPQCPGTGLQPGRLDPESSAQTTRRLPRSELDTPGKDRWRRRVFENALIFYLSSSFIRLESVLFQWKYCGGLVLHSVGWAIEMYELDIRYLCRTIEALINCLWGLEKVTVYRRIFTRCSVCFCICDSNHKITEKFQANQCAAYGLL